MIAFQVYLDGKKLTTAGVGDLGVLTAIVDWVRRKGEHTRDRKPDSVEEELDLHVGGLITPTDESVRWVNRGLKVGSEVRIKVVEARSVDQPRSRARGIRKQILRSQNRYVRDVKKCVREMARRFGWKIQTRPRPVPRKRMRQATRKPGRATRRRGPGPIRRT